MGQTPAAMGASNSEELQVVD
jgi:hypothetical protein